MADLNITSDASLSNAEDKSNMIGQSIARFDEYVALLGCVAESAEQSGYRNKITISLEFLHVMLQRECDTLHSLL